MRGAEGGGLWEVMQHLWGLGGEFLAKPSYTRSPELCRCALSPPSTPYTCTLPQGASCIN